MIWPNGMTFDSAGNFFASSWINGNVLQFDSYVNTIGNFLPVNSNNLHSRP